VVPSATQRLTPVSDERALSRSKRSAGSALSVVAGGALFVANDSSAANAAASIFADMQAKVVIGAVQN